MVQFSELLPHDRSCLTACGTHTISIIVHARDDRCDEIHSGHFMVIYFPTEKRVCRIIFCIAATESLL